MRLANERTLELNITHQLLSAYRNSFALGYTQQRESATGIDNALHTPYRVMVLQYKATKAGTDGQQALFHINNNSHHDQHTNLHRLANWSRQLIWYAFPLVVTDAYFRRVSGNLIPDTVFIRVRDLPAYHDGVTHSVVVWSNGDFIAHSEPYRGKGITGQEFTLLIGSDNLGFHVSSDVESVSSFIEEFARRAREYEISDRAFRLAFFHPVTPFIHWFRV